MTWPVALAFHSGVVRLVSSRTGRVPKRTRPLKREAHRSKGPSSCSVLTPPSGKEVVAMKSMTAGTGSCGHGDGHTNAHSHHVQRITRSALLCASLGLSPQS